MDEKIVIDFNELHERIADILIDHNAEMKSKTLGLNEAFWLLRVALQKPAIRFKGVKFMVIVADQKPEYQQLIKLLEKYKITYTTFI